MTWLSVKEAAALLEVGERAVQKDKSKYEHCHVNGIGQGGRPLRIALESLPKTAQNKYKGLQDEQNQSVYMSLNQKQRADLDFKYRLVLDYKRFKSEYPKANKMVAFLEKFQEENPNKKLTKRQLNHWENLYDRDGISGLVDRRGGHNKGSSTVPKELADKFLKLWLKDSKPTVQSCYDFVSMYCEENNLTIPNIKSFQRIADSLDEPIKAYYRDGKKAYQDKYEPHIIRDESANFSNEWWTADHHVFDVLCVDEKGNVFRPWLSGWQDQYSKMIVGYALNKIEPNSDIVLDSFARPVIQHGIPDGVKLDNGKDYKTLDLFRSDFSQSICNTMNIKVSFANPYNAKAKPIERFFGTVEGRYCKHLPSYIGNAPHKRPEKMRKLNKDLKDKAMPWEEFKVFVDNMIKTMNTTPHSALEGRTPLEVYRNGFVKNMRVVKDTDVLNMFLMRTTKPLKVGRNGIRVPAIGLYFTDDRLFPLQGKTVFARYNADDISKVYIFTENQEFVCAAKQVPKTIYGTEQSMEQIRELQRKKKAYKKFVREQMPDVEVPTVQEFVAKKSARYEDIDPQKYNIHLEPMTYNQAKAIKEYEQEQGQEEQHASAVIPLKKVVGASEEEIDKKLFQFFEGREK